MHSIFNNPKFSKEIWIIENMIYNTYKISRNPKKFGLPQILHIICIKFLIFQRNLEYVYVIIIKYKKVGRN